MALGLFYSSEEGVYLENLDLIRQKIILWETISKGINFRVNIGRSVADIFPNNVLIVPEPRRRVESDFVEFSYLRNYDYIYSFQK
ncbi:MAG: hypothetical protein QXM92_01590 [Candidatus Anstonellales archaeon]